MADNRIYLAHTNVNFCIFLGKSLGYQPWYKAPDAEKLERYYDMVFKETQLEGEFFLFSEDDTKYYAGMSSKETYGFNKLCYSSEQENQTK